MDQDVDGPPRTKEKSERRRSSIFSLLKRQKKLTRQCSEPVSNYYGGALIRKYSVDSAILSDFKKNGSFEAYIENSRDDLCNGGR